MVTFHGFAQVLDFGGTFVFAVSGAMAAVNRRLDVFGVLVLSFVAGTFGGIARDLLIGAVPPAALVDERYLLVSVLAGLIVYAVAALAGASVVVVGDRLSARGRTEAQPTKEPSA